MNEPVNRLEPDDDGDIDGDLLRLLCEGKIRDGQERSKLEEKHGKEGAAIALAMSNIRRNPELLEFLMELMRLQERGGNVKEYLNGLPSEQQQKLREVFFTEEETN